ncbi:hypothetical protein [Paraburkholderia sp. EG304]|uniref:hypothetical protein n=1 Tax=Paraburkholderia sp. EG304 TaxID=3237015 RepID=UPI00397CA44D
MHPLLRHSLFIASLEAAVQIFGLTYPGTRLDFPDPDVAFQLGSALDFIVEQFADANVALIEFDEVHASPIIPGPTGIVEQRLSRSARLRDMKARIRKECPHADFDEISFEAHRRIIQEHEAARQMPASLASRRPHIHARSFVHAMEGIRKRLKTLAGQADAPATVRAEFDRFELAFPRLKHGRDSEQHRDERERGKASERGRERQIIPHPIVNDEISAPVGGFVIGALKGRRYTITGPDGALAEIEVSAASMTRAQEILQSILDAFPWRGPKRFHPGF